MKKYLIISLLFLFIPSVLSGQEKEGHNIDITIHGLGDSTVYLAYHLGNMQYIKDTITLDDKGYGQLSGQEPLPQGIYMIVLPGKKYFEVLMSDDQQFSMSCSFEDFFNTLKFTGSEENSAFIEYQKDWKELQQKAISISGRLQKNQNNNDSLVFLTAEQKSHEERMKSFLRDVVEYNNGNLLSVLVKAIIPLEIPEFIIPEETSNPDSLKWILSYNYNKDHFFDNIDLTDERLIRTPILYSRLNTFFTDIVIQSADSINKEIDKIIMKCQDNYKVFQFVSVFLFNHYRESEIMGHDAVLVKLADDIYLSGKADWVTEEFLADLRKQVDLIRPNLIGLKAANLIMDSYKGIFVSLYDIEKEFTVLYFYSPDCGHCNEETGILKAYYDQVKDEGVEVFAVCTLSDKPKWTKYIEENNLTWINGWDPERLSHFDYYYNVQATPMIYVLDRDKNIIAKKLAAKSIGPFIDNYRNYTN